MARARSLKPGFFTDEKLAELGPLAMLCFAGIWTVADREGRLEERPKFIKSQIFPYREVKIQKLIDELVKSDFLIRYEYGGRRYLQVRTWCKHQNPHVKEQASTIPPPCLPGASPVLAPDEHSSCTPSSLTPCTLTPLTPGPVPAPDVGLVEKPKPEPRYTPLSDTEIECDKILREMINRHREGYLHAMKITVIEQSWSQAIGLRPDDCLAQARKIDAAHQRACETNTWQGRFKEALDRWLLPSRAGWNDIFPEPEDDGLVVVTQTNEDDELRYGKR
jgi:hypothetical protein